MNRRLLLIFVLLLSLLPSLYLAYLHMIDSFLYTPLSEVSSGIYQGKLSEINPDQPIYVVILYTISAICNISPLQLAYLPIGAVIFPLCIYALARRLLKSRTIPILLLLYFAFDFSLYQGQYNVLAYAWAHPLFIIFVLLYIMYSTSNERNPGLILLILVVFTSIVFLHPTYVFWAVSFAVGLNVITVVSKLTHLPKIDLVPTFYLTIALFIIYFGFNQLYFGFYLHRVILIEPDVISEQFVTMIRSFLGISAPLIAPYQIWVGPPTTVIGYAAFARTTLLVSCILIGVLAWIKKNHREFAKRFDNSLVLMVALLLAGMMHTIGYAVYGHISMRFMILIFPIIAVFLLRKADLRRTAIVFVSLIIVLAFSQTISYVASDPEVDNVDIETAPYANWLISHTEGEVVLLSDFRTSQITKYHFKSVGREILQRFYTSEVYAQIVTGDDQVTITEFVALNWEFDSTPSVSWATFEPIKNYEAEIGDNSNLNGIYDDGRISLMRSNYFQ